MGEEALVTILEETKRYLNIENEDTDFDLELTDAIENSLMTATQLTEDQSIPQSASDDYPTTVLGRMLRQYVNYSVKLAFDPPATSFTIEAIKQLRSEIEWRLTIQRN